MLNRRRDAASAQLRAHLWSDPSSKPKSAGRLLGHEDNLPGDADKKPLKSDRSAAEELVGLDENERNDERSVKSFPAMKSKSKMLSKVAKSKTSRLTRGEGKNAINVTDQ